jgi:REP element-mobilizing transposase RayT
MSTWNDADIPLAYLITFRTYGTWLAGDGRGSIDKYHNKYGGPRALVSHARERSQAARLKSPPFVLNAACRKIVEEAIKEVCLYREWALFAMSVRSNHAHAVVSGKSSSEKILNDLKAYSTRYLRETGQWTYPHSPWVDKGSRRFLWTAEHMATASEYVLYDQGGPLPEFD